MGTVSKWFALAGINICLFAQSPAVAVNPGSAKWQQEAAGSESVVLREDPQTGSMELLVRYPAGHVFTPHWHDANERIVLLEGRLKIDAGQTSSELEPGGFAFLPAKEVQHISCISKTRCGFYVYWDGKSTPHKVAK